MGLNAVILSEEILHFIVTRVKFSLSERSRNTPVASHKSEGVPG